MEIIYLKKIFRWTVTLSYAAFIFYLSSRSWSSVPLFPFADKIFHVILYLGLGGFLLWTLRLSRLRYYKRLYLITFAITILYGLSDETHQLFVAGREFSLLDLAADGVGAVLGVFIASKIAIIIHRAKGQEKNDNKI